MTMPLTSRYDVTPGMPVAEVPPVAARADWPDEFWSDGLYGGPTTSGVRVTPMKALGHGPVWQAINLIAGDLGQLPMRVRRREPGPDGSTLEIDHPDHPVDWLLNEEPNEHQTPDIFVETMIGWALLAGNGVAVIVGTPGRPEALVPLHYSRTQCVEVGDTYGIVYTTPDGRRLTFGPDEVLHIRGLAVDGFWGRSCVDVARDVIGSGLATSEHGASVFRNGAKPSGVLAFPQALDAETRRQFRSEWESLHRGSSNAHRVAILQGDAKYQPISMTNEDAQLIEGLRLNREQTASLFNLPPYKLGAMEHAAVRANLEEQGKEYYQTSLARWANRFRQEVRRKLFTERERRSRRLLLRVDTAPLTAGGEDQRMSRAVKGVQARLLTKNEGRELIGKNPVEGGHVFENPAIDTAGSDTDDDATDGTLDDRSEAEAMAARLAAAEAKARRLEAALAAAIEPDPTPNPQPEE